MATIVFDLDGTLIDTAPDLLASTNAMLTADGREPIVRADLDHLVGRGGRAMLARAFAMRGRELGEDELDELIPPFLAHYEADIPGASKPYQGMVECLDRLAAAGHTLAICTNKFEHLARALMRALDLADRFATIAGPDTFDARKPDPAHLLRTIDAAGGDRTAAIMVGDSINDIEAARRANVPSIGVPFGYTDVPMARLSPTVLVETFAEIDGGLVRRLLATVPAS